jgi:DHA2 family methylenomycin A resistance protein-like MFS transporter
VLNATRQTGSVIGVALFGSLIGRADTLIPGARESVVIATILLISCALVITVGRRGAATGFQAGR